MLAADYRSVILQLITVARVERMADLRAAAIE